MAYKTINPTTNEELKTFESLSRDEVVEKIRLADEAFTSWRNTTFEERKKVVLLFAEQLRERTEEFAGLITLEMGKRISEARAEIQFCAEIARFYANGAEEFLSDEPVAIEDAEAYIQHVPIGVLLGVMPWNFPFYQVTRFAAPNLMAGNTVLVRHASCVPQCALAIQDLFDQCGLPAGAYTNLFIPTEFVDGVIEDARVRGVSLTGSEKAGRAVAATAGRNLKRTVMELGGNDAFIVLEDADLDDVVEKAIRGRMVNTGQSCVAAKRFIVVESLADEFIARFKKGVEGLKLGDPMDEETDIGPLSTEEAAVNLNDLVQHAIDDGATVVTGGGRPDRKGAFFTPTILTDITPGTSTYDTELFGPVATIYRVRDEEAAIRLANDSSYGLGGSVYTKSIERARHVAERIDTGMMFINQPTNSQADLPFGGTKNSGYGRELSHLGILEFINKKLIHTMESFAS